MISIYDIYKIIQNFIVNKLNMDTDKVIINYDNSSCPDLPYIGIYIDSIDMWSEYNDSMTEDGTETFTTVQSVPVLIDFYGDLSSKAMEFQQKLLFNSNRTDLELLGLSVLEIGSIEILSKNIEFTEFMERYQIRCIFQTETTTEDTDTGYFEDIEIDTEINIDNQNPSIEDLPLATLDEIIVINRSLI